MKGLSDPPEDLSPVISSVAREWGRKNPEKALRWASTLTDPELRDDVPFCLQRDCHDFVAGLQPDGTVRREA